MPHLVEQGEPSETMIASATVTTPAMAVKDVRRRMVIVLAQQVRTIDDFEFVVVRSSSPPEVGEGSVKKASQMALYKDVDGVLVRTT